MTDDELERSLVSWLALRGYLITKVDVVDVEITEVLDPFDEFWASYPRKVGKPLARKAFAKAGDPGQVLSGLYHWREVGAFAPVEKYRPHASTWLNQKCYLDDPVPYGQDSFKKPQVGSRTRSALDDWLNEDG